METVQTLIDKAAVVCGGQNKLAERIGYDPSQLSRVKRGVPLPLPMAAELAAVLGPTYAESIRACLTAQEPAGRKRDAVARFLRAATAGATAAGLAVATAFPCETSAATSRSQQSPGQVCVMSTLRLIARHIHRMTYVLGMARMQRLAR